MILNDLNNMRAYTNPVREEYRDLEEATTIRFENVNDLYRRGIDDPDFFTAISSGEEIFSRITPVVNRYFAMLNIVLGRAEIHEECQDCDQAFADLDHLNIFFHGEDPLPFLRSMWPYMAHLKNKISEVKQNIEVLIYFSNCIFFLQKLDERITPFLRGDPQQTAQFIRSYNELNYNLPGLLETDQTVFSDQILERLSSLVQQVKTEDVKAKIDQHLQLILSEYYEENRDISFLVQPALRIEEGFYIPGLLSEEGYSSIEEANSRSFYQKCDDDWHFLDNRIKHLLDCFSMASTERLKGDFKYLSNQLIKIRDYINRVMQNS